MKQSGKILVTLEEIAAYSGRSKNTILKWVEEDNYPATKVDGRWESNTDLIDSWQRRRIERRTNFEKDSISSLSFPGIIQSK